MEKRVKQNMLVAAFGIILFAGLMNLSVVLEFAGKIVRLILPIISGAILALFINVPLKGVEKRLKRFAEARSKRKFSDKQLHILSFVITLLCVGMVLALVLTLLVPEIIRSCQSLYEQIKVGVPRWFTYFNDTDMGWLEELLVDVDPEQIMQNISGSIDAVLENIANMLSSTASVVVTAAFSVIVSIYMTLGKEQVCRHARKLVCAYLKPSWSKSLLHFSRTFSRVFSNFLSGQCCEAAILGTLMFLAFTIFKLPYGSLVGVLTAVCAIIPYVGAFISGGVSAFLALLIEPSLAVRCLVVYIAVQFIENQLIYPRVVGGSVGLPPLYTLIAAMIGGKLFGIIGIIFFIPLMAVAVELIKENAGKRLDERAEPL